MSTHRHQEEPISLSQRERDILKVLAPVLLLGQPGLRSRPPACSTSRPATSVGSWGASRTAATPPSSTACAGALPTAKPMPTSADAPSRSTAATSMTSVLPWHARNSPNALLDISLETLRRWLHSRRGFGGSRWRRASGNPSPWKPWPVCPSPKPSTLSGLTSPPMTPSSKSSPSTAAAAIKTRCASPNWSRSSPSPSRVTTAAAAVPSTDATATSACYPPRPAPSTISWPVCPPLAEAFLAALTARLRPLFPAGLYRTTLPDSLAGLAVIVLGRQRRSRRPPSGLLATRAWPGKLYGGKVLAAYLPMEGLVVARAASASWRKAFNKKRRPHKAKEKELGAQTSVHKILEAAKAADGEKQKVSASSG